MRAGRRQARNRRCARCAKVRSRKFGREKAPRLTVRVPPPQSRRRPRPPPAGSRPTQPVLYRGGIVDTPTGWTRNSACRNFLLGDAHRRRRGNSDHAPGEVVEVTAHPRDVRIRGPANRSAGNALDDLAEVCVWAITPARGIHRLHPAAPGCGPPLRRRTCLYCAHMTVSPGVQVSGPGSMPAPASARRSTKYCQPRACPGV